MSILTVGTVAFDDIETPFGKVEKVIGGACTYISWAASYFTNDIRLTSVVGGDFPDEEIRELEGRGVNMEGLKVLSNGKTFFWAGKYHENMNMRDTITTDLNVLDDFDPELPASYYDSKYVMLGNLTPEIQNRVIDQLSNPRLIVLDTMNFWMDIALENLKKAISRVQVLTINDEEARQLSGEYSLVNAAEKIFEMGPKYLVIKKGEHGALLISPDQMFYAPALPLSMVKDPTGAGDTFAGGFIGHLAKTDDLSFENLKRAVIYGSAMASFCVEEFSLTKMKKLSQDDIRLRVQKFVDITSFDV
ncbi:MAG: sugar kinase [Saprospiraceae bacterium]|nr:bifunctional hydroxymethylpyrimidine kinase/phosphomethylpyrimidine kinase [Bacteroidia bacterium]NNF21618.1 sugar kinase [Saprospiraceae bacterium]NNK89871.1 sugar kinase [Saprospiraceae bacterium]